jgi:mono/diheme cytochrome c family protein
MQKQKWIFGGLSLLLFIAASGCTKNADNSQSGSQSGSNDTSADKGVGPVTELKMETLNPELAASGKEVFHAKCSACHKLEEKFVGPALNGVSTRRQPEWIMNMILNPAEMTVKDPIAKDLLGQYMTQMSFQNVSQPEARQILEYFRKNDLDSKK